MLKPPTRKSDSQFQTFFVWVPRETLEFPIYSQKNGHPVINWEF